MISSSEFFKKTFVHREEELEVRDNCGISPWHLPSDANLCRKEHTSFELKPLRKHRIKSDFATLNNIESKGKRA